MIKRKKKHFDSNKLKQIKYQKTKLNKNAKK